MRSCSRESSEVMDDGSLEVDEVEGAKCGALMGDQVDGEVGLGGKFSVNLVRESGR